MSESTSSLGGERNRQYFSMPLGFMRPGDGYLFVIDGAPYSLREKIVSGGEPRFVLEEILQLPDPGTKARVLEYPKAELLDLLDSGKALLKTAESGTQYLAHRLGTEVLNVGDEITVTATGTRRRVVGILGSLGGIITEKIISAPEGEIAQQENKPWDMNSVVTGLRSGKITIKRPKKQQPVG